MPQITRLIRMQYNTYVKKQTAKGKEYMSLQEFAAKSGKKKGK